MDNLYITEDELRELGVKLDGDALQTLLDDLNDKVDELIGEEVVGSLTPADVDVLANMQENSTEEELATWIVEHVPDYPEIMENNKDIVLGDFADSLSDEE